MEQFEQFREASRRIVRELGFFKSCYGNTGITSTQAHILIELSRSAPLNLSQLVDAIRMDKSTASRTMRSLLEKGWIKRAAASSDKREKYFDISREGSRKVELIDRAAADTIENAFANLTSVEKSQVEDAMELYAKALLRVRLQCGYLIRPIKKSDEEAMAEIILQVLDEEYDESEKEVIAMLPEYSSLCDYYKDSNAQYFVIEREGRIWGGAGIAPFGKTNENCCELQKMYFSKEIRGLGLGNVTLKRCIDFAKECDYRGCYLDTRSSMTAAKALYEKHGFIELDKPMGDTGHYICDNFYYLDLVPA